MTKAFAVGFGILAAPLIFLAYVMGVLEIFQWFVGTLDIDSKVFIFVLCVLTVASAVAAIGDLLYKRKVK